MSRSTNEEPGRPAIDLRAVWGVPLAAVNCAHCGEAHLVPEADLDRADGEGTSLHCPLCLQGALARQPAYLREEPPEQALVYEVSEQGLSGILKNWSRRILFRPQDLSADVLARRARRYLVPLWLVDGRVEGVWRADVGFDYQVVSYQDRYSESRGWSSQEVTETRARWEPRVGRLSRRYENLVAPALDDHPSVMGQLGSYDLSRRTAYSPEAAAGAVVRVPSLEPQAAWAGAEMAFVRAAEVECQRAAGADHIRGFTLEAEYRDLNWTLLLLPAYVTWYREGGQAWPVLVNGQSGRVSGARRASARKANLTSMVMGSVALLLFLLGALLALPGLAALQLTAVGGVLLVLGTLLAIASPVPAIGVWISNRRWSAGSR